VLEPDKPMDAVPKWFLGAKLNLAENLLWANDDRTAIIAGGAGWPLSPVPMPSRADAASAFILLTTPRGRRGPRDAAAQLP